METLLLEHASERELRFLAAQLDRAHLGVMLLDRDAHVLRASRAACALLLSGRGLALCGGRLVSTVANGECILRELARALASGSELWFPVGRDLQAPLAVLLRPVDARSVLALVSDPERLPVAREGALRRLFGLTDAEARIASRLARGQHISCIADELGVQANTCRSHLKAAYAKTGSRSQAQLAVRVATSVAVV